MKPATTILTAVFLAVLAAYGTVKLTMPESAGSEQKTEESAFDRVIKSRTLRCGYVAYEPYLIKDANTGKMSGIFYDLTEKMGKLLNLKIDWNYETSFATFLDDAKMSRFDAYCGGLWPEAAKAHGMQYTIPVNYVGLGLYVRKDDTRFDGKDISVLNDEAYTFSAMDGEMSQLIKIEDFPKAKELAHSHMTDISTLMLDVVNKKADALLIEKAGIANFEITNPNSFKDLTEKTPIRLYGNTWATKIGEDHLISMMNTALQEMLNTGFVAKTVKKYEKVPGSFYPVANPYKQSE